MPRPILHPRMLERLGRSGFYPSVCTLRDAAAQAGGYGVSAPAPDAVPGLQSIPCAIAPAVTEMPTGARENRREALTVTGNAFTVELAGYYPAITSKMQAEVDGVAYNILGEPEHDSLRSVTRLRVELVST